MFIPYLRKKGSFFFGMTYHHKEMSVFDKNKRLQMEYVGLIFKLLLLL